MPYYNYQNPSGLGEGADGSFLDKLLGYAGQVADLKNKFDPEDAKTQATNPKAQSAPVLGDWWQSPLVLVGVALTAVLGLFLLLRK